MQINTRPATEMEVVEDINILKKSRAIGPDGLLPYWSKDSRKVLALEPTKLQGFMWQKEQLTMDYLDCVVVPIYKKIDRPLCEYRRGYTLVSSTPKLFERISLPRLPGARERWMVVNYA